MFGPVRSKYLSAEEKLVVYLRSSAVGAFAGALYAISVKALYGCFLFRLSEEYRYPAFFPGSLISQKAKALYSWLDNVIRVSLGSSVIYGSICRANRVFDAIDWDKTAEESFFLGRLFHV